MANVGSAEGTVTIDASGATKGAEEANKAFASVGDTAETTGQKVTTSAKTQADEYDKSSKKVKSSSDFTGKAWVDAASKATVLAQSAYILLDSYDGVQKAQTANERATLKLSKANEAADKAQKAYNEAVAKYGADSPQAIQAANDLAQAQDASAIAAANAEMAAGNVNDAWAKFVFGGASSALGMISGGAGLIQSLGQLGGEGGILGKVSLSVIGLGGKFSSFASSGVSALTGGLSGIGKAFTALGSLMMANPVLIVLAAIAAIAFIIITNWDAVKPFFEAIWNGICAIFQAAWNFIDQYLVQPLMGAWNALQSATNVLKGVLTAVWNAIVGALQAAWNLINQYVVQPLMKGWNLLQSATETMKGVLIGIWNAIVGALQAAWNLINQYVIRPLMDGWNLLSGAANTMKGILIGVWDGIKNAIKNAVDFIMSLLRPLIDTFKSVMDLAGGIGDAVGSVIPKGDIIPGLHLFSEGGVVDRPTLGMIGEGGEREFIIPQSKLPAVATKMAMAGLMDTASATSMTALSNVAATVGGGVGRIMNGDIIFQVNGAQDARAIMREIYNQGKSMRLW